MDAHFKAFVEKTKKTCPALHDVWKEFCELLSDEKNKPNGKLSPASPGSPVLKPARTYSQAEVDAMVKALILNHEKHIEKVMAEAAQKS